VNINYIASAGTGKTHNLISDVIEKIEKEGISLKKMLILTFTEKAASELKEKISERIKDALQNPSTPQQIKVKLHRELLFVDTSYTGTFHSVFLRILRKYPEITGVDSSTEILSDNLDRYLQPIFESWLEEEFDENKWSDILEFFDERGESIKELFISFYKSRGRVKRSSFDIGSQKKKIETLQIEISSILNQILEKFGDSLGRLKKEVFKHTPEKIAFSLQTGQLLSIKEDEKPTDRKTFLIKRPRSEEEKKIFNELIKNREFTALDSMLFDRLRRLYVEGMELKTNLILDKYYSFEKYVNRKKSEDGILDFTDILLKTDKLLKDYPEIKSALSDRFKYIFVDEFQDTDIIQARILEKLAQDNLHIYGDPKQCIYTWRDANLYAYFEFIKKGGFKNIVLQKNYRSTGSIVKFINLLLKKTEMLQHIDDEYRKPINWDNDMEGVVGRYIIKGENDFLKSQAYLTGEIIHKLLSEGYSYNQIMVLFRKNQDMEVFRRILSQLGIPAISYGDTGLFDVEEIKHLMNLLRLIAYPEDRLNLLKVLKSPMVIADEKDIYLHMENPMEIIKHSPIGVVIDLIEIRRDITPAQAVKTVIQKTDAGKILCMLSDNPAVSDLIKKLESVAEEKTAEGYSLREFILWSETAQMPIPYTESSNAVVLQTIHSSKGLESKAVILPLLSRFDSNTGLNHRNGEVIVHKGQILFYFPSKKVVSKDIHRLKDDIIQERKNEEERLFYVAITRAKERLLFIQSDGEKENRFSQFLDTAEINGLINRIEINQISTYTPKQTTPDIKNFKNQLNRIKNQEEKIKQTTLQYKRKLRNTTITELLSAGGGKNTHTGGDTAVIVGTAVHHILEFTDFGKFDIKQAIERLRKYLLQIPAEIREDVFSTAEKILKKLPDSEILNELKSSQILFRELPFTLIEGQTFLEGRIDLVYQLGNQIVGLDFKTNRYSGRIQEKRIINDYTPQAQLYKKALKKIFPDRPVVFKLALLWTGKLVEIN